MAVSGLHLLVTSLVYSHLIFFPASGTRLMLQGSRDMLASGNFHQVITEETVEVEVIKGRMDLEQNDYPGPGANNRHTPKTPNWIG